MSLIDFIHTHQKDIIEQICEHVELTVIALAIAVFLGLPLGIILTRYERLSPAVLGVIGIIQTIPSVALLGFLLPVLGIGVTSAVVALTLYALLPIVRNTSTGIEEVDPSVQEAAKGMGMSDLQILLKVELPLAVPVIFAGIRTATIINVGIATLCALIGAGGLGEFIFRGIALNNIHMILAGAVPAALLALFFDLVLSLLQKFIRQLIKPLLFFSAVVIFVIIPFLIVPSYFERPFTAGFTAEFMQRTDGYPGLKEHYHLSMNTVELDPGLMYQALKKNKVDVICGFSTDGRIRAFNFRVLKDDKNYFPPYHVAPLVRGETLRKYPVLREVFTQLAGRINGKQMRELNFRADYKKEPPAEIAEEFVAHMGFKQTTSQSEEADIVIASKNFTEQYILAHIFEKLIERASHLNVKLKTGLAGTKICFDALINGVIDMYPEYTGTGLHVILKADQELSRKMLKDSQKVYEFVKKESKKRHDLEWLQTPGFNNTFALMMREKQAEKFGIDTISDLKNYLEKNN